MELTWFTFTLAVLLFCIMAVLIVRGSKSSRLQINQVEIVDIDASSGMVRGSFWAHVYSPTTREYDFSISEPPLPGCATTDRILSWQGLPGAGLGGMQSNNDMGGIRTSYVCPLRWSEDSAECRMQGVPIPIGSTKAFFGRWLGASVMEATSRLSQHRRLDALVGTVTNPLPVELSNCVLVYKDWAYVLNRPLSPGETVDIETELQERTLAFIRRRATGEQASTATWDPTDRELPRILEMMMFFDAIGGTEYTRLSNLYHRDIDLSHLRHLGRAMLIGRVRGTATTISVDGRADPDDYDQRLTMVRLVLPVEPRTSNQAGRLP